MKRFKLRHIQTNIILAEGDVKNLYLLEGNYYIKEDDFIEGVVRNTFFPGLCFYKFIYIWVNLNVSKELVLKRIGWKYILPNPIFFKIFKRIGIPINQNILKLEK